MNKIGKLLACILCVTTLAGCWDRTEINDLAFVIATGLDKEGENRFRASVQVPLPSAMGGPNGGGGGTSGSEPYYVDSGFGRNVREADDDLQKRMSRQLLFSHRRIFIFGEEMAASGIEQTLNSILEHPESRLSTYLLIAKGDALDILMATPHFEELPSEAVREMVKTTLNIDTRNIINDLSLPGKDPVIPVVETVKTKNKGNDEREEIQINSTAIMKDDKLVFFTNEEETNGIYWLLQKMKRKKETIAVDKNSELNIEILDYKITPTYKEAHGLPEFTVKLHVEGILLQNEARLDLEDLEIYKMATNKFESHIKNEIEAIISHAKSEGVDPYGLGYSVYKKSNRFWEKQLSTQWRELLPNIKVNVDVEADIVRINNKGIKVREV